MSYKDIAIEYCNDIISGKIIAGENIIKVCKQFFKDLNNPLYYYNAAEVDARIVYAYQFYFTEIIPAKLTKFEKWQLFIKVYIYGIYVKSTNKRLKKIVYLEVGRGNGKTQMFIPDANYDLTFGKDSQVIIAANTNKQVVEVDFDKAKKLIKQIDPDGEFYQVYESNHKIVYREDNNENKLIITSNESEPIDGLGGSFILIDEFHEMDDLTSYNVLRSSMPKRQDSIMIITTSSGFDVNSECYRLRQYCIDILDNIIDDPTRIGFIYSIDKNDEENIQDKNIWIKANPNLNISVFEDDIKSNVTSALNNPSERAGVLVKHFGVWLNVSDEKWLDEDVIVNSMDDFNILEERFKNCEIWCGVDLANVSDVTAVSFMWKYEDIFYFQNKYFLCEDNVNNITIKNFLKEAGFNKQIEITKGNVTDYTYITEYLISINKERYIKEINYDRWNSIQWAIDATNYSLNLKPYSQRTASINIPLKDFETKIKQSKIKIQNNYLTKWMLNNAILTKPSREKNQAITKKNNNYKIDGVASMLTCLGGYLDFYYVNNSNYTIV